MGDLVYAFGAPPLPFGALEYPVPFAFLLYSGVDPNNLGSHEGKAYLIAVQPFNPAAVVAVVAPPFPFGETDYPLPLQFAFLGQRQTNYLAATIARSSAPTDVPANTYVPAKFAGAFNFGVSLFAGADPTTAGSATIGVLELNDTDGEFDGLLSMGWDGAPLTIQRGDPATLFSSWPVVANLTAAGILYEPRKKQVQLRDLAWQLNQAELHGQRYGGTGGADGDLVLKGTMKPYAVGYVWQCQPVQVSASLLIYQMSISSMRAIVAVRDGGAPLAAGTDYPDWATLAAATVPGSTYATCLALGLLRLGSTPVFLIRVDAQGDNDIINGQGFPVTRAQIARRIATGRGPIRLDDGTQIDFNSLAMLEGKQPGQIGYYWDQAISKAQALSECMNGCLGWWAMRLNGQLSLGQIEDPANSSPALVLSYPAAGSGEVRVGEPIMIDYKTPRRASYVGWSRNYGVQPTNQQAGSVDQVSAAIYATPTRYAQSVDTWVGNAFPNAQAVYIDGGYRLTVDAQLEAERQQTLLRTRRERWQVPVVMDPLADVLGRVVRLDNSNRLGMGAAKPFLCVGVSVANGPQVTLDLWG